jgi:hypothetical protein
MRLEAEQLALLSPADRNRYMALEALFDSDGWKIVMALAHQSAAGALQRAALANSWAENRMAIGNSLAWNAIFQLQDATENDFLTMAASAADDAMAKAISVEEEYE